MKSAFMIAAPGSGSGKTTITCSMLLAIKNKKLNTRSFKCGPDYIDPMFHKKVLGIESQNLDSFFSDEEELKRIFYSENDSEVSLVEGVMGLFDGIQVSSNEGSSYDVARKLQLPIILVINARGMGRSLIALIRGFLAMDEDKLIKGVILNQISPMYFETIRRQIEEELNTCVFGYFPKMNDVHIESRYLGLKMPEEIDSLEKDIEKAADIISKTVDIDKLLEECMAKVSICNQACVLNYVEEKIPFGKENKDIFSEVRIAVAKDEAFCFYYDENLKLLKRMGAKLVEFSPIHDKTLPQNIDGLILGGGYPELYAKQLASNKTMLDSIKSAINKGLPSLAECGGFMYLHHTIEVMEESYEMVGVIDGDCIKTDKLVRFGYLTIEEESDEFLEGLNKKIRGHEFHYYDSTNNGNDALNVKPSGNRSWKSSHISKNHWWGFAHLYYPSNPDFIKTFIKRCEEWRKCFE